MSDRIGIRREDMYAWERRVPLVPSHLRELSDAAGVDFVVQSSPKRAFSDDEYRAVGLPVADELSDCPIIIGLKEVPVDALAQGKTYVFFSHTIKGQPANMPMLRRGLELGCTFIDYERIVDEDNRRLVFFGNYAGLAGAIDTLWTLGRRLKWEGIDTPLAALRQASEYSDLAEAKAAVAGAGERIAAGELPPQVAPLVIGIAGYGNVSKGAQEILDLLPIEEIAPADLLGSPDPVCSPDRIVKVVFREEDTVQQLDPSAPFDLLEYYDHPERYRGAFARYLPKLHTLINCVYWEPKYPRLITRDDIRELYAGGQPTLRVLGDISCDIEGSIEVTVKAMEPNDPVYVVDPSTGMIESGIEGQGPVMMAVDILPSELPREASTYFSGILKSYVPAIAAADFDVAFDALALPPELKRAVICHRGALAPDYRSIEPHLVAAAERGRDEGVSR